MEYLPAEGQTRATPGEDGVLQHGDGSLAAPMGGVLRSASRRVRDAGIREADGSPRGEHMPTMRRPARPPILLHRRADRTGEDPTREADGSAGRHAGSSRPAEIISFYKFLADPLVTS